jgi:heavy metal efflux system protein
MTIPFALSFAIGLMVLRGESANLLSVGAIDFGLVVDATVIMVENIFRHLAQAASGTGREHACIDHAPAERLSRQDAVIANRRRRGQPVDLLRRRDHHRRLRAAVHAVGHRGPYLRADGEDLCLRHRRRPDRDLHVAPALSALLLRKDQRGARDAGGARAAAHLRAGARVRARQPHRDAGASALLVWRLRRGALARLEFLPKLEEGNLWVRATLPTSISLEDRQRLRQSHAQIMKSYPEVETVVSQHGRPDDGTDATGFFNAEFFVPLKPFDTWPAGIDKEKLTET